MIPTATPQFRFPRLLAKSDPDNRHLFATLQGNILSGHGRQYGTLLPGTFEVSGHELRQFVASTIAPLVTSMAEMLDREAAPERAFLGFHVTRTGYDKLGWRAPLDPAFTTGMAGRSLGDPDPQSWSVAPAMDALIIVAHDVRDRVADLVDELRRACAGKVTLAPAIDGYRRDGGRGHFGFRDGISQPRFIEPSADRTATGDASVIARAFEHDAAPLADILVEEPDMPGSFGSYLVFRRLRMHRDRFEARARDYAARTAQPTGDQPQLEARLIGRDAEGRPLATLDNEPEPHPASHPTNTFSFEADSRGDKCPFSAHIRKMNPRDAGPAHPRIARRGFSYGADGDDDKGVLFMCFQASIRAQYERLQQYANNPYRLGPAGGPDALIGQGRYADADTMPVVMTGGGYFFTPSLARLGREMVGDSGHRAGSGAGGSGSAEGHDDDCGKGANDRPHKRRRKAQE